MPLGTVRARADRYLLEGPEVEIETRWHDAGDAQAFDHRTVGPVGAVCAVRTRDLMLLPPTSKRDTYTAGVAARTDPMVREPGRAASCWASKVVAMDVACRSMTGELRSTLTFSWSVAICSSTLPRSGNAPPS